MVLRPWELVDADWYASARDEEILRWTSEPRNLEPAEVRTAILKYRSEPGFVCLAITGAQTGELLGNLALGPKAGLDAEISYWLAPDARGRGIATEAVKLLSDWAFAAGFTCLQKNASRKHPFAGRCVASRLRF